MSWQAPQDAGTVPVRVQVIDVEARALDLVVPTYITAGDLTYRLAEDAGLGAYWEDGTRRKYWIRARGRVLEDHEKFDDLGIVPYELLHLLPEPPKNSAVVEQLPDYPMSRGYAARGFLNIGWGMLLVILWTAGWAGALSVEPRPTVAFLPGLGLALLTTSMARHLWGGHGSHIRIPITGMLVFLPCLVGASFVPFIGDLQSWSDLTVQRQAELPIELFTIGGVAALGGIGGVVLAWLAWYGAVEPLPRRTRQEAQHAQAGLMFPCAICGGPVSADVKADCQYQCGRVFHTGCYRTREAMSGRDICSVCGQPTPGAVSA